MIKKQKRIDELLTREPVIGQPVVIRIGDQRFQTSPVVNWYIGIDRGIRIETAHTIYIK